MTNALLSTFHAPLIATPFILESRCTDSAKLAQCFYQIGCQAVVWNRIDKLELIFNSSDPGATYVSSSRRFCVLKYHADQFLYPLFSECFV